MNESLPSLAESTLPAAFLERVRREPDGTALVVVRPDVPDVTVRARELLIQADRFARALEELKPGHQVVAICLYHGLDLHAAYLGALLAGQVPTMIAPPSPRMERHKYIDSFVRMIAHIRPAAVIADPSVMESLREQRADVLVDEHLLDPDDITRTLPRPLDVIGCAEVDPDSVALLQHSSGTTGLQKGIALSHRATLNQLRSYAANTALTHRDVVATWLPLYHDMGLIACFLLPVLAGVPIVQISPFDWVLRPAMLLQKITEYRASLCWLPNFAYAFMSKSVRDSQLAGVDLHSIRAFINCSEPVMAPSHDIFVERFSKLGVTEEQLVACYAMAENVFAVTQSPIGQPARRQCISREIFQKEHRAVPRNDPPCLELISNGPPIAGVEVQVVGEDERARDECEVGEICIRGQSLFDGYYGRDDLTEQAFLGEWYRTGDLGYLSRGELFVTGRKKDLIIIQGRNFYPADLESAVSEVEGVIDGRVVAFGEVDAKLGTETLVLIAETEFQDERAQGQLKLVIKNCVAQTFDCTATHVHCVPPRWIVKSTAGKVARPDNRKKYEALLKS